MIILTDQQAAQVRGPTLNGARLEPRKMILGRWALPEAVLTDPNQAPQKAYLSTLPRREVSEPEWFVDDVVNSLIGGP